MDEAERNNNSTFREQFEKGHVMKKLNIQRIIHSMMISCKKDDCYYWSPIRRSQSNPLTLPDAVKVIPIYNGNYIGSFSIA